MSVVLIYSYADVALVREFDAHAAVLSEWVPFWDTRKLRPGDNVKDELARKIKHSDSIILFLSPSLLWDLWQGEGVITREMLQAPSLRIIPVLLIDCDWTNTEFGRLACLPRNGVPALSWEDRNQAWRDVISNLWVTLKPSQLGLVGQLDGIHPDAEVRGAHSRYKINYWLAAGSTSEVWAATDSNGHEVAIKFLTSKSAENRDRFRVEMSILKHLRSPHICEYKDSISQGSHLQGMVMEKLTGETLDDRLKRQRRLSLNELRPIIFDVLRGLAVAHSGGVIHRHLNPTNIFLDSNDKCAKIIDFGVGKITHISRTKTTLADITRQVGLEAGHPEFFSREQLMKPSEVDARTDFYALGAVVYISLAGALWGGGDRGKAIAHTLGVNVAPSLFDSTGVQWPTALEAFIRKTLARNREDRFSNAFEALQAWQDVPMAFKPKDWV